MRALWTSIKLPKKTQKRAFFLCCMWGAAPSTLLMCYFISSIFLCREDDSTWSQRNVASLWHSTKMLMEKCLFIPSRPYPVHPHRCTLCKNFLLHLECLRMLSSFHTFNWMITIFRDVNSAALWMCWWWFSPLHNGTAAVYVHDSNHTMYIIWMKFFHRKYFFLVFFHSRLPKSREIMAIHLEKKKFSVWNRFFLAVLWHKRLCICHGAYYNVYTFGHGQHFCAVCSTELLFFCRLNSGRHLSLWTWQLCKKTLFSCEWNRPWYWYK